MADAAARSGRPADAVRLIAVSKTFPIESVREAYAAGQREFGENRVQEAVQKIGQAPDLDAAWHLIGHLQSNKARKAAEHCAAIHSVDSVDILTRVDVAAASAGRQIDVLIQADLAGESTKHGAPVEALLPIFEQAGGCKAARVVGLMLIPPIADDAENARVWFRQLREQRDRLLAGGVPADFLHELSMGMSHDFEVAIEEGATMIRVGSAIFGSRA
jgi:PLP dependent protein